MINKWQRKRTNEPETGTFYGLIDDCGTLWTGDPEGWMLSQPFSWFFYYVPSLSLLEWFPGLLCVVPERDSRVSVGHLHVGLCALLCLPGGNTMSTMSISAVFDLQLLTFCLDLLTFSDWLHQCDILGDESRPSLHELLLQPVQRIPDYLLLLQVGSSQNLCCFFKHVYTN